MTPEQEAMFRMQSLPTPQHFPGQVQTIGSTAESEEIDELSQGLSQSVQYMASNGPTRPIQRAVAATMTKEQLEEQKMNEAQGLPANIDEASRVKNLEGQVTQISDNMGKMAEMMSQLLQNSQAPSNAPATVTSTPPTPPGQYQIPVSPVPPHTPQVRPADVQPQKSVATQPIAAEIQPPFRMSPRHDLRMGTQTSHPEPLVSQLDTSHSPSPPKDSPATMSMGPVGSSGIPEDHGDQFQLTEVSGPGEGKGAATLMEVPDEDSPQDLVEQKRLERQQILTDQVFNWLKSKDPHKFWRQFLAGACNKNLSYNTWPEKMQGQFNERFTQMIGDASFISTLCGRIMQMQNGHMVAAHVAGAFVVVVAGMLSFSLSEG